MFFRYLNYLEAISITAIQRRSQGGCKGHPPLPWVFQEAPDGIRALRRPTLAKITSEADEIHGNPKNSVRITSAL